MPLTMRDLLEDPTLELTAHGWSGADTRAISWVHTSELADPTPFLEGGELLLTTGLTLRADVCADYVRRLYEADVAGLGFGVGLGHDRVPPELTKAAAESGLPLIEVPRRTPFIAISKAVSRALAADEYEGLRRISHAQHELAKAAGTKQGIQALVRKLAALVEGWVLVLDPTGEVLHAAPNSAADTAPALAADVERLRGKRGRAAVGLDLDEHEVSMQVLSPEARAVLAVGRGKSFGTDDHHVINSAASLLTLALQQIEELAGARRKLRGDLLRMVIAGEPAREALDELRAELPQAPVRLLISQQVSDTDALLDRLEFQRPRERCYLAEHDGALVAVVHADGTAQRWLTEACELTLGVSEPCEPDELAGALRQARQAVSAAGREGGPTTTWFGDIGGRGVLGLLGPEDAEGFAESTLAPLRGREDLLDALREWLAFNGQWDPAASRLGVHRHTLRNRIRKVEQLTERGLDQPGVRAELWLAMQVRDRARA